MEAVLVFIKEGVYITYMVVENLLQFLTATATIMIALAAFYQLRESRKDKQRSMKLKTLKFLYKHLDIINAAIKMIPEGRFNNWNIENGIKSDIVVFYSLPKDIQTQLREVSIKYNKLREEQQRPKKKKTPEIMKDPLLKLKELIEKKIDSLISDLDLDQI